MNYGIKKEVVYTNEQRKSWLLLVPSVFKAQLSYINKLLEYRGLSR